MSQKKEGLKDVIHAPFEEFTCGVCGVTYDNRPAAKDLRIVPVCMINIDGIDVCEYCYGKQKGVS